MRFASDIFRDQRIPQYTIGGAQRIQEVNTDRNRRTKPLLPYEEDIIYGPPRY